MRTEKINRSEELNLLYHGLPACMGDNPFAKARGEAPAPVGKHGIAILYHPHQCRPCSICGLSVGAMVLGKLPVPRLPTNLDKSRARAYCACSRCGWGGGGLFGHFFSHIPFLFSFSLSLGDGPI